MKVLICWSHISGYITSCWRALAARGDVNFSLLAFQSNTGGAIAFEDELVKGLPCKLLAPDEQHDAALIRALALEAKPDIIVIPGWFHEPYLRLARDPAFASAKIIMTMDTPRRDTFRQKFGRYKIAWLIARISRIMVAGERAWQLAKLLGAPEEKIRRGMYGVDHAMLSPLYEKRLNQSGGWPKKFLFTGRYVQDKGIDVLLEGYRAYRQRSRDPWPLTACGAGPLASAFVNQEGASNLGFVQPKEQIEILAEHGAFVMSSRYDPWPLALVEACASGLPVIHSEACGSAVEVVRNYFSGLGIATGNASALADAMLWCEAHHADLAQMGRRARSLAEPYSAQNWALRWKLVFDEITNG